MTGDATVGPPYDEDATVGPPCDGGCYKPCKAMKTKMLSLMLLSLAPDLLCHLIPD